jgi:hypothetical protein
VKKIKKLKLKLLKLMYNNNKVHINIIFIIMMIAGIFTVDYTRLPDFLDYWW